MYAVLLALSMYVQNFTLLLVTLRFPLRFDHKPVTRIRDCGLLLGLFEASSPICELHPQPRSVELKWGSHVAVILERRVAIQPQSFVS